VGTCPVWRGRPNRSPGGKDECPPARKGARHHAMRGRSMVEAEGKSQVRSEIRKKDVRKRRAKPEYV